ncbi:hypothetical protein PN498_17750 [Oscillatoria sp. CS-180]|uniref:hypothetical protein n=1 Tax=Oscillatoria sp. CS-180 TaxID=3021720 RepID=UPI00232EFBF6|nr:hypothetical protein [Oscillatoria sp. CS-180]MDB9527844.1 hypothetical protein [Oscillatoria sp. CS-180]
MASGTIQGKMDTIEMCLKNSGEPMPRRERFSISPIGEYYRDLLEIDAWINARTASAQANSLLCAKLQERETRIKERVAYLAKKRGITADEMWVQILKGDAEDLSPGEIVDYANSNLDD